MKVDLSVYGIDPAPQGSKRHIGKGRMVESSKRVGPGREAVRQSAVGTVNKLIDDPVEVRIVFRFIRPKSHYLASGKIRQGAPKYLTSRNKGDLDKLCRSTLDGLSGSVITDDSQVVKLIAEKHFCTNGEQPGALIRVEKLT